MRDHGVKASVKKEKETRWFSRKFCVCEARKGPNPTPFIADDSWPLFVPESEGILNEPRHVISETQPLII